MSDLPIQVRKRWLRDAARATRSLLSHEEIEQKSRIICDTLLDLLDGVDPVLVYVSKPLEVGTKTFIEHLIQNKKNVVVPIIEKDTRTLRLSYLTNPSVLVPSTFHVAEPIGNEIPARPCDVKVVIVPMLGYDKCGNRLGYGAGYYDRFLSANPNMFRIGLAFSALEVEEIPADENDMGMDVIITEQGIIRCGSPDRRLNIIR